MAALNLVLLHGCRMVVQEGSIRYRACLLLKMLLLDLEPVQAVALQYAAINYGVLLWQLHDFVAQVVENEEAAMRDSTTAPVSELMPEPGCPVSPQAQPSSVGPPETISVPISGPRAVTRDLIVLICMENDLSYETMTRALPLGMDDVMEVHSTL